MPLVDFILETVPEFDQYINDVPNWYRQGMDYGIAKYLLEFAVSLLGAGDTHTFVRILELVERGICDRDEIGDPLCIDFVQRIADLEESRDVFLSHLGTASRACYVAQFQ